MEPGGPLSSSASSASAGMIIRGRRIFGRSSGNTLIIPLDHGITTGVVPGLADVYRVVRDAAQGGADAVMLRPGLARVMAETASNSLATILCLTGRLASGVDHVLLNTVEAAIRGGADAVNAEFKLGSVGDLENARIASLIAEEAHQYGLPVLMTAYALPDYVARVGLSAHAHACRIAEELGADIIKTGLPQDPAAISDCVNAVRVPIVMAGGAKGSEDELVRSISTALKLGVRGAAVGRNVWAHADPASMVKTLAAAIHGDGKSAAT